MEFLLNEKSLCGQFEDVNSFLISLKPVISCIKLIHDKTDIPIYKTSNFYNCHVTKDETLCNLKHYECSDELLRFKSALDTEIYENYIDLILYNFSNGSYASNGYSASIGKYKFLMLYFHTSDITEIVNNYYEDVDRELYLFKN